MQNLQCRHAAMFKDRKQEIVTWFVLKVCIYKLYNKLFIGFIDFRLECEYKLYLNVATLN